MGWHHQNLPIKNQIFPGHIQPSLKNHRLQSGYLCRPLPSRGKYASHSDVRICHFKLISVSPLRISSGVSLMKCELTPKTDFLGLRRVALRPAGLGQSWDEVVPPSQPAFLQKALGTWTNTPLAFSCEKYLVTALEVLT